MSSITGPAGSGGTSRMASAATLAGAGTGQRQERLESDEEQELIRLAQTGDEEATERLLKQYEPLIAGIVARLRGPGLDWDDLLQEGRVGLLDRIHRFQFARGARLSTAGRLWVRWRMEQALAAALSLPLPEREWRLRRRLHAVTARLESAGLSEPGAAAAAAETGLPLAVVATRLQQRTSVQPLETLSAAEGPFGTDVHDAEAWQCDESRLRIAELAARLSQQLGRLPTPEELGPELGLDVETLEDALEGNAEAVKLVLDVDGRFASHEGPDTVRTGSLTHPCLPTSGLRTLQPAMTLR